MPVRIPLDWDIECASFLRSLQQRLLLLMDYQYVDWVTIANLSAEGNAGCQAAIPFAVHQHRVDIIEECSKIGLKLKSLEVSSWNMPILVDFLISSSHITGNICFDPNTFRPEYIDSLLKRTEAIYLQLCQFEAGICLKDLQISF
ncbi:hypothetical protein BGW36DRAFT_423332 [Talaromyces proteolyticus]|uniref:Uncharacterized protein n=1 Tax=Talaromyces proteolyticus TaxID=1131652 RepID=A0AAD4L3Z0_9EURO|nr:uncharacterized protein BGW36DRAFT_423332 [Talaromyces proteolyticus]KAH8703783.1 hypothetical protein BGW36DRAFT_423332 [Talaromyces proteolyticus]